MPLRSPRMKRRILGFQRRVWCPKWTPESRSSCKVTRATKISFRSVDQPRGAPRRATVRNHAVCLHPPTLGEPNQCSRTRYATNTGDRMSRCWREGLAPRMRLAMDVLQARLGHVGVELRRRQALVTQELLDHTKIGPPLEQVGSVGVAQRVGVHVTQGQPPVEDGPHAQRAQA